MKLKSLIKKVNNLIIYLVNIFIYYLLSFKKAAIKNKTLLIIRLDSIGDYVLFRNFIEILAKSNKYKGYKITLCGNILWKELAETFDKDSVESFIWIDRNKFYSNPVYKYKILKIIRSSGFEVVIDPTYTREILFGDCIVRVSGAVKRIGCTGSLDKHSNWKRNLISDSYYTNLYSSTSGNLFEFYRNKEFFEKLFGTELEIKKPYFDTSSIFEDKPVKNKYIVFIPGANDISRIWDTKNFIEVAHYILQHYSMEIVICGSEKEEALAKHIIEGTKSPLVINLAGNLSISGLVKYIEGAELVISNETGPVHIAAAVNTPFICISNGNHLGRFNPYPVDICPQAYYLYPGVIEKIINTGGIEESGFRFSSQLNINEIPVEKAKTLVNKILSPNG